MNAVWLLVVSTVSQKLLVRRGTFQWGAFASPAPREYEGEHRNTAAAHFKGKRIQMPQRSETAAWVHRVTLMMG